MHYTGLRCNWVTDSLQCLNRMLSKAWMHHVCRQVRRIFFDIQFCSSSGYKSLVKNCNAQQKGFLHHVACGRHVTNDALQQYSYNLKTECCPFCHEQDEKETDFDTAEDLKPYKIFHIFE